MWFVGVTPRRNPELVVAVLWQNGGFSYFPARIGAQVVSAYVEKQRRLDHNLASQAAGPGGGGRRLVGAHAGASGNKAGKPGQEQRRCSPATSL